MNIPILYQDDQLMVIDKPAGITVNRADTVGEETVQDWAQSKMTNDEFRMTNDHSAFNIQHSTFLSRSGIVHRLDKETSGCLIIAKTETAFIELQRQFKQREVKKEYLALVHGRVEPKQGTIRVPLARSRLDRQKFSVSPGGRIAETSYQVVSLLTIHNSLFTLLKLFPTTGRTHQIRVHLKYFGHPIVSDEKYGGEKRARQDRHWCPRLFLHAAKITFIHPITRKTISLESPFPNELTRAMRQNLSSQSSPKSSQLK